MATPSQEACVGAAELPRDALALIMSMATSPRDLAACARVCSTWHAASEVCWAQLRSRHFPSAHGTTVALLQQRTTHRTLQQGAEREIYRWLAQQWVCDRCGQAFTDGGNAPAACTFHPGILFSGGQLNGTGLRFTCCDRRAHHIPNGSRDANGCASAFHVGGRSAWQRKGGAGVQPRELPSDTGCPAGAARCGGGGASLGSSPSRRPYPFLGTSACLPMEWHPHQRPGLLELPSRLFS